VRYPQRRTWKRGTDDFNDWEQVMRVLIADCDSEFLEIAKRFMNQCGHEALVASNGLECIACLRGCLPDVVVLDCELLWGGSDGVCELMNGDPTLAAIPVILITDETLDSKTDAGAGLRVVDQVEKPYSLRQLIGRIHAYEMKRLEILV